MEHNTNPVKNTNTAAFVFPQEQLNFCYACCGNCRYYDGNDWCGQHRCYTTGGDHCSSWEDRD